MREFKIKSSVHSPKHVSKIVNDVNAYVPVQLKEGLEVIFKGMSIEGSRLHHVPMDTTRGWS